MKIHKHTSKLKKNLEQMAINILFSLFYHVFIHPFIHLNSETMF